MPEDARRQEVFGPKFYIETDSPVSSEWGPEAFALKGTNDDKCGFVLAHHESNQTRLESEGNVFINAASKGKKDEAGLCLVSWGGSIELYSDKARVGIKALDEIVLESSTQITLKAPRIQIGDQALHGTEEITLNASRIQVEAASGNLATKLGLSWGAKIAFGPGGFLGAKIVEKFFNR